MKDYLSYERDRNTKNAALFTEIVQRALGSGCAVIIGHHITFEMNGDLTTENEIPSADSLMFDHEIMDKVFGEDSHPLMVRLALAKTDERDAILKAAWREVQINGQVEVA